MATRKDTELHLRDGAESDAGDLLRAALSCFALAAAIIAAGFLWIGRAGMLEAKSPDFVPVPHFFAFASAALGLFFLVRSFIYSRRYKLFGVSDLVINSPELGGSLQGTLKVSKGEHLASPLVLRLRSEWRYRYRDASNRSQNTTELLWERTQQHEAGGATVGIPFQFELPEDGLPSGRRPKPKTGVHPGSPGDIYWILRASCKRAGTDYVAEFEIPVRAGKLIRELSKGKRVQPAPQAAGQELAGPLKAMAATAGMAGAVLLGGHVPTQDELDAEAEADQFVEPQKPFASSVLPAQPVEIWTRRIALVFALFFGFLLIRAVVDQWQFSTTGRLQEATVVDLSKDTVTLNFGPDDPSHLISVSSFHSWERGQTVQAICQLSETGKRLCAMESKHDRWFNVVFVGFFLAVALTVWRMPRWRRSLDYD